MGRASAAWLTLVALPFGQDVQRIEREGPKLEDLVHTHVIQERDEQYEAEEVHPPTIGLRPCRRPWLSGLPASRSRHSG